MALSTTSLHALRMLHPNVLLDYNLTFFEFMKYETDDLRNEKILDKNILIDRFYKIAQNTDLDSKSTIKRLDIKNDFEKFTKKLDQILVSKNDEDTLSDIKWEKIIEICDLLRRIERSDEKKIRWILYYLFSKGKQNISLKEISENLSNFKVKQYEKILGKILKEERVSGLDAILDKGSISINHEISDKLVAHYLVDALEESSRRSPGELEEEILKLLDEGSYSNQEISKILTVDEAMVSRSISKLRNKNKLVLSSFGQKGLRYYTTNCENCPFGKTTASCRKEALSYIISAFKEDYNMDLSTKDFDDIESNQSILQMKRIFTMSRKDNTAKLEHNLYDNLTKILSKVVDKSLEVKPRSNTADLSQTKIADTSVLKRLPVLYQIGLYKGAQRGVDLMDEILKQAIKSVKQEDRDRIKKHAIDQTNKFLQDVG